MNFSVNKKSKTGKIILKPLPPLLKSYTTNVAAKTTKTRKIKKLPITLDNIFYILMTPFYKNSLIYNDENMNAIIKYILQDEYVDGEYKINITKIREHIRENKDGRFNEYHKYINIIRNSISEYDIYELTDMNKTYEMEYCLNDFKKALSTYDPFDYENEEEFKKIRKMLLSHIFLDIYDAIFIYEFRKAIIHDTEDNVTKNTLKNKIISKMPLYNMLINIANFINTHYKLLTNRNFLNNDKLINILINYDNILIKNIYIEPPNYDLSSSLSSGFSSSNVIINGKTKRANLLNLLLDNTGYNNKITESDTEPISLEVWGKMSYSRLKKVVKISYQDVETQKNYYYLYEASSLYKLWRINKTDNIVNPMTRLPITEEEKRNVLFALNKRDFRKDIKSNKKGVENARYDVELFFKKKEKKGKEYLCIAVYYMLSKGIIDFDNNIDDRIEIVEIYFDIKYQEDIKRDLFKNIIKLYNNNKIVSTKLPLKLHPAFTKYNFKIIDSEDKYIDFLNMINN
jgi:hypothetical protein